MRKLTEMLNEIPPLNGIRNEYREEKAGSARQAAGKPGKVGRTIHPDGGHYRPCS